MEEARKALTDRLIALAKVHDVLTRESWEGAELYDLIAGVTSPHAGGNRSSTVRLCGRPLPCPCRLPSRCTNWLRTR